MPEKMNLFRGAGLKALLPGSLRGKWVRNILAHRKTVPGRTEMCPCFCTRLMSNDLNFELELDAAILKPLFRPTF